MRSPVEDGRSAAPRDAGAGERRTVLASLSDEELVLELHSALPGDTRAFDELVRRHEGHIRANCRFLLGDAEAAQDLSQEVFVRAYFALKQFEGRSSFRTWLRRIKANRCLSYRADRRPAADLTLEEASHLGDEALRLPAEASLLMESGELAERIVRTFDRLPDTLRIPLVLRDMDGFSYEEIREMLGIGLSAVKMRIMRGREAFRAAWESEGGQGSGER